MTKKKSRVFTPAQLREQRAQQITVLTNDLNRERAEMLTNFSTWSHEKMHAAMTRAHSIRKELDKLMKK